MKRTKIIDVLKSTEYGKEVCVKGWVRTHRSSKAVDFIALNDGSTIKNVQIVVDPAKPRVFWLRARAQVSRQKSRPHVSRFTACVATTILCRRRVRALR